jgi:hypothetical protein
MYNKIPAEIMPLEASAKITYVSAFDLDFCLLLRERRETSLAHMQDASSKVYSNVLAVDRLRNKADRDRRRGRSEASTSSSSTSHPQVDEFQGKQSYKSAHNDDNRGNFRSPNIVPWILPRDPHSRERDD